MGTFNYDGVKNAVELLLKELGEDPNRPGLKETPRRVAGYWKELLEGNNYTNEQLANELRKDFKVSSDPMVTLFIDKLFSHCEHHLALMYDGDAIIGYIPTENEDGTFNVIGLSKIPRIVDLCCKRLQLQEKIAQDIAECIMLATGSKEVYVNLNMKHACVSARGIKADSFTNVTYMTPELRNDKEARSEFERKAAELVARNKK